MLLGKLASSSSINYRSPRQEEEDGGSRLIQHPALSITRYVLPILLGDLV